MLTKAKKRTLLLIGLLITTGSSFFTVTSKKSFSKSDSVFIGISEVTRAHADAAGDVIGSDGCGAGSDGGCSDGCY